MFNFVIDFQADSETHGMLVSDGVHYAYYFFDATVRVNHD